MCKINNFIQRAQDDIINFNEVRQLVENISSVRQSKINKILESIPTEVLTLKLNNICAKELEQIRLFLNESFNIKYESLTTQYNEDYVVNNEEVDANNYFNTGIPLD